MCAMQGAIYKMLIEVFYSGELNSAVLQVLVWGTKDMRNKDGASGAEGDL